MSEYRLSQTSTLNPQPLTLIPQTSNLNPQPSNLLVETHPKPYCHSNPLLRPGAQQFASQLIDRPLQRFAHYLKPVFFGYSNHIFEPMSITFWTDLFTCLGIHEARLTNFPHLRVHICNQKCS